MTKSAAPLDRYQFHSSPFSHQRTAFKRSADLPAFALFMEQGTGKTKILLDTAAYLYEQKKITGLLIIADNGIHQNWVTDEVPKHWPARVPLLDHIWDSGKAGTKRHQLSLGNVLRPSPVSCQLLAMNIDALITSRGAETVRAFLKAHTVLAIVDESTSIKTPKAKRTRAAWRIGEQVAYRRIASGLPAPESPLELYGQFKFLDPRILGFVSYLAFKHYHAAWVEQYNPAARRRYEVQKLDAKGHPIYLHLDELITKIQPYSFSILKKECLDLPAKLYQKRYFTLGPTQQKLYTQLRDEGLLALGTGRHPNTVMVTLILTQMLRLQQIASGFLPLTIDGYKEPSGGRWIGDNARLRALDLLVKELSAETQAIIWCRFKPDVDAVMGLLGERAVRYDGRVPKQKDRLAARRDFQSGKARFFVGNPRAGSKGLTLTAASVVIYYSNYFNLELRLQSEDRAHRIGQTKAVTYIDLIAQETVDAHIITSLREKRPLAEMIMGSPTPTIWI